MRVGPVSYKRDPKRTWLWTYRETKRKENKKI